MARTTAAKQPTRRSTRRNKPETYLVRHSPEIAGEPVSVIDGLRIGGHDWHRVDAATAAKLRDEPRCDLPGHHLGQPMFRRRFDVLREDEFTELVATERVKIGANAQRLAEEAAAAAIATVMPVHRVIDLGSTIVRLPETAP